MSQSQSGSSDSLVLLADIRTATQENARRMVGHLAREIDYGYPAATVRGTRQAANHAITAYFEACDAFNRAVRKQRRQAAPDDEEGVEE